MRYAITGAALAIVGFSTMAQSMAAPYAYANLMDRTNGNNSFFSFSMIMFPSLFLSHLPSFKIQTVSTLKIRRRKREKKLNQLSAAEPPNCGPAADGAQCDPNGVNPCCSNCNYCGNTPQHCDIREVMHGSHLGCNPDFGGCWSQDGRCGREFQGAICEPNGWGGRYEGGGCCSQYGNCGGTSNTGHCEVGCQSGQCNGLPSPTPTTTASAPTPVIPSPSQTPVPGEDSGYHLIENYMSSNFFDGFEFYNKNCYNNGYVDYKPREVAEQYGLIGIRDGKAYMGVDSTYVVNEAGGFSNHPRMDGQGGRASTKIHSNRRFGK
jgi:hypothetical protein